MMKKLTMSLPLVIFAFTQVFAQVSPEILKKRPKLVVLISIDQFRADYIPRFRKELMASKSKGKIGGFNYLIENGAYYPYAEFDILQSMTGPGHATLLTGSYPYQNGISVNEWWDRSTQESMYCAEDTAFKTLEVPNPKKNWGTSPKNLNGTTFGDELKNAGVPSVSVAVALKDRAAIMMGGHRADLAFWFEQGSKTWTSSDYYVKSGKLPDWMQKLTTKARAANCDLATPCGLTLNGDAAIAAMEAYQLGTHAGTDLLAVGFSSHDYAGHKHGPNAPIMEKMVLEEDVQISRLLNQIQKKVPGGLDSAVIVLSADHGIPPSPELLNENGIASGRVHPGQEQERVEKRLVEKFGKAGDGKWIVFLTDLNFYLNEKWIAEKKMDLAQVEAATKAILLENSSYAYVFSSTDYRERRLPPLQFERQILKTYSLAHSGNLVGIPKPFFFESAGGNYPISHMTGYVYDRTVPLILTGKGIKRGTFAQKAEVIDIAPTLSFIAGVMPPALCEGRVLHEALAR